MPQSAMSEPSVLTYARYFNLTRDYTLNDPLSAIDTILKQPHPLIPPQKPNENVQNLVKEFEKAADEYVSLTNGDPLPISEDAIQLLKTCTNYNIDDLSKIYNDLLPDSYRLRKLKLDLPLLTIGGGDVYRDVRKIRRSVDLQRILNDFLLDEDDEKDKSSKHEPLVSPTLSADFLKWLQDQVKAITEKEKIDVSVGALMYLREALSTPMGSEERWRITQDLLPQVVHKANIDACVISPDDFDIESEVAPTDVASSLEVYSAKLENLPPTIKKEMDLLSRLDIAVDDEFFMDSTQADKDVDELFRQFTHHDIENFSDQVSTTVNRADFDEESAPKRRKLAHLIAESDAQIDLQVLDKSLNEFKIQNLETTGHQSFKLPDVDITTILGFFNHRDNLDSLAGCPPLQTPTIHEAICSNMPPPSKAYERYLVDGRNITSSDKLLWKEPGLRVLDHDEADEKEMAADDFDIEDCEQEDLLNEEFDKVQRMKGTFSSAGRDSSTALLGNTTHQKRDNNSTSTTRTRPFEDIASPREEVPAANTSGTAMTLSNSVNSGHYARTSVNALPGLSEMQGHDTYHHDSSRLVALHNSSKPLVPSTDTMSRSLVVNGEVAGFRSLLPKSRVTPAPNTAVKKEYKLDDSLASFLDLRGKQFKFPIAKPISRIADIVGDPIQSIQDSCDEKSPREGHALTPKPAQSVEVNHEEVLPLTTTLDGPRTIIVNNTLLQTKKLLIQSLERPNVTNLTLIYRDLDLNQCRGPDLILNSTTCLLITNLQSLNQRGLPGQKSTTGLSSAHDQLVCLAHSYSQVVVLVHHIVSTDDASWCKTVLAQASFSVFCNDLSRSASSSSSAKSIQPYWLPCVDPSSTSKVVNAWVWQVIASYAHRNASSVISSQSRTQLAQDPILSIFIQDETLWEVFLCKAGLNSMAAQIVLGSLRKPDSQNGDETFANHDQEEPTWGLRKFVAMSPGERVQSFAGLIGLDVVKNLNKVFSDTGHSK